MLDRLLTESLHKHRVDVSIDTVPVTCPDVVEGYGRPGSNMTPTRTVLNIIFSSVFAGPSHELSAKLREYT